MPPAALAAAPDGETTAAIAARVALAFDVAVARQGVPNARLEGDALDAHTALGDASSAFLQAASARLGWSARTHHRVLRIARTIADLAGEPMLRTPHLAEAIQHRRVLSGA